MITAIVNRELYRYEIHSLLKAFYPREEVKVLTPEPEEEKTYWQEVGEGFMDTLRGMGQACKTIFQIFVAALPILALLAVIAVVIVLLARKHQKKRNTARAARAQEPPITWTAPAQTPPTPPKDET